MADFYAQCEKQLAQGKLNETIEAMLNCLNSTPHTSLRDSVIMQSARIAESNRRIRDGISDPSNESRTRNMVRMALMTILREMKDEGISCGGAVQGEVTPPATPTEREIRKILFFGVNPKNTRRIRIDEEVREIEEELTKANQRDGFELTTKWAIRSRDLQFNMVNYNPDIIHFSGHGEKDGILIEDKNGLAKIITDDAIELLFSMFNDIQCVVLNACYTYEQAKLISQFVPFVIGLPRKVKDTVAIQFSIGFYMALGAGKDYKQAFKMGLAMVKMEVPNAEVIPILIEGESTT